MKKEEKNSRHKFMLSSMLSVDVLSDLYWILKDCVPDEVPEELRDQCVEDMGRFLDGMFGFAALPKSQRKRTNGWYTVTHELGRKFAPTVFGRRFIKLGDAQIYVSSTFSEHRTSNTIPRMLEYMVARGIVRIRFADRERGRATQFKLTDGLYLYLAENCFHLRNGATRFLSIRDYARYMNGVGRASLGLTISQMVLNLQKSKTTFKENSRKLSSYEEVDTKRCQGIDGIKATTKYREMFQRQKEVGLDFSNVDEVLSNMLLDVHTAVISGKSNRERTALRSYYRRVTKGFKRGESLNVMYAKAISKNKALGSVCVEVRRHMDRYISIVQNLTSILLGGRAYFDKTTGLVVYKPLYEVRMQGGRSYEARGGFQTLAREFKSLIAGDLVDNYDIKHCHLTIIKGLAKRHNLEHLCPILCEVEDVSTGLREAFVSRTKSFECFYTPSKKKNSDKEKEAKSDSNSTKLSFSHVSRMINRDSAMSEVSKILLYATLNNGSNALSTSPRSDTGSQIIEIAKDTAESYIYCVKFQYFLSRCWNQFCEEEGIYSLFEALTKIYIEQASVYDSKLILTNSFGVTVRYPLTDTVKDSLGKKDRKRVLNHIVTGHEVSMIHRFVTENALDVYFFEHDGVVVRKNSHIKKSAFNDLFLRKSFD